jgi:hypothetical protein
MEEQLQAKQLPYNKTHGFADGQLLVTSAVVAVAAGSNLFVGAGFKFVVDGEPLLELRRDAQGRLTLTVALRDAEDNLLMSMVDNEWVTGDPLPWDLEFHYNLVRLRRAERRVALEIDARSTPVTISGDLWRKGQQLGVSGRELRFNGVARGLAFIGIGFVGMSLTVDTQARTFHMKPAGGVRGCLLPAIRDQQQWLQLATEEFEKQCREAPLSGDEPCPCGNGLKFKECHQVAA